MDETLTAYLSAPLPTEVLEKAENPANHYGKYVFLHEIGRGATATVVKAWDTYLSRHVALKFLQPSPFSKEATSDSERVQDFLREARVAARLQHPNIVPIYEVDYRDGRYFISMDLISGGTLSDLIHGPAGARVPTSFYRQTDRMLGLLRTIAGAIHHAHSQTPPVVHRDLKPQNVLIDPAGRPYVADFGLANEIQVETESLGRREIRGTPSYMSPEQAAGADGDIDRRTDVYSLGAILYEMLSGEPPFRGQNIPSVLRRVVMDPPEPPGLVVERFPAEMTGWEATSASLRRNLESICLKALAKKKEDRFSTALEFGGALGAALAPPEGASGPPESGVRGGGFSRKARLILSGIAALVLILAAAALGNRRAASPAGPPTAPGDDVALLAKGLLASGQWNALGKAVEELRRRAPAYPGLGEFETALTTHHAQIEQARLEWAELLEDLIRGDPAAGERELKARLHEFDETENEFRSGLHTALERRQSGLREKVRELVSGGPSDAWLSKEVKEEAAKVRAELEEFGRLSSALEPGFDVRFWPEERARVEPVLAYRGRWNLRINVHPFAEFRVLEGSAECARDFTPSALPHLLISPEPTWIELAWPSLEEPKIRWSRSLSPLKPGETLVIFGRIEEPNVQVRRE
jgi:tRNA A-37 threonylcarbamoyl transferase component Bud32